MSAIGSPQVDVLVKASAPSQQGMNKRCGKACNHLANLCHVTASIGAGVGVGYVTGDAIFSALPVTATAGKATCLPCVGIGAAAILTTAVTALGIQCVRNGGSIPCDDGLGS